MGKQISTGLKNLFLIHFIFGTLFGVIFLFFPLIYGNIINWNVRDPGAFRLIGAAMIGISFTSLLAFRNPVWEKVRIIAVLEIVWPGLGALATVWAILFEGFPPIAWMNAAILALFAIFFLIFFMRENK
jgi:hypothetical protein